MIPLIKPGSAVQTNETTSDLYTYLYTYTKPYTHTESYTHLDLYTHTDPHAVPVVPRDSCLSDSRPTVGREGIEQTRR